MGLSIVSLEGAIDTPSTNYVNAYQPNKTLHSNYAFTQITYRSAVGFLSLPILELHTTHNLIMPSVGFCKACWNRIPQVLHTYA